MIQTQGGFVIAAAAAAAVVILHKALENISLKCVNKCLICRGVWKIITQSTPYFMTAFRMPQGET